MKPFSRKLSILLSVSLSSTEGFVSPRPVHSLQRPRQAKSTLPELSSSKTSSLLYSTVLQEAETTTRSNSSTEKLPTYPNAEPISTLDDYQHQQSSLLHQKNLQAYTSLELPRRLDDQDEEFNNNDNKLAKFAPLATWITALSSFLLVNNFVGPWPANLLAAIPVKAFGLTHAVSGMLFGGGIILTTLMEWLATGSKNASVLNFYFDKVPKLDALVVLPALTASIVSGVGLAVDHYDSLGNSPFHVVGAISTLLAFAIWWAVTDVTTQGIAMKAIQDWIAQGDTETADVPQIVQLRKISNIVSCLFVVAIYGFMVLKPGFTP